MLFLLGEVSVFVHFQLYRLKDLCNCLQLKDAYSKTLLLDLRQKVIIMDERKSYQK